jgi:hypothetical protein
MPAPQQAANRVAAQRDARPHWALKAAWLLRSWTGARLFERLYRHGPRTEVIVRWRGSAGGK